MIRELKNGSFSNGRISPGCKLCGEGAKMVLFVSGICDKACFYCPLSERRRGNDIVFADEGEAETDEAIINEAESISASGTSLTGGEPMLFPERCLHFINILKNKFGEGHHIHMYTTSTDYEKISELLVGGLDEVRFHIPIEDWKNNDSEYFLAIKECKKTGKAVGVEIPGIPDEESLLILLRNLQEIKADFVNINELEFMDRTWPDFQNRGYEMLDGMSCAVSGSYDIVRKILEENTFKIPIHFCSSPFKDGVQLRNRLLRRAKNIVEPWEEITEDGTIIKGIIEGVDENYSKELHRRFKHSKKKCKYNHEKKRLELSPYFLEGIANQLDNGVFASVIEEYPTVDALEVERTPLNYGYGYEQGENEEE